MQQSNIYTISYFLLYSLNSYIKTKNYYYEIILLIYFKFICSFFFYLRKKESKRNRRRLIHQDITFSRIRSKENWRKVFSAIESREGGKKGRIKIVYIDIIRNVRKRRYRGALLTDIGDFHDAFRAPTLINCLGS